jgi:hypothetical protein
MRISVLPAVCNASEGLTLVEATDVDIRATKEELAALGNFFLQAAEEIESLPQEGKTSDFGNSAQNAQVGICFTVYPPA